jgi:hypothetical protein
MTRPAAETDATKGTCARALSQRATSMVDTRTRTGDPFTERSGVVSTLRYTRSRDPDTSPGDAIAVAIDHDHLVALPRPGSGRDCLTVRDARRIAACHARYRTAGEAANAEACAALLREGVPEVLGVAWVRGP